MLPTTPAEFGEHVRSIQDRPAWRAPKAFAFGIATLSALGEERVLDTSYPIVNIDAHLSVATVALDVLGELGHFGTFRLDRTQLHQIASTCAPILDDGEDHPNVGVVSTLGAVLDAPDAGTRTRRVPVITLIESLEEPPLDAHDVYLRLHLLSHRAVRPHGVNLDGIFGLLSNVVWTNHGPCDPDGFDEWRAAFRSGGHTVSVTSVDKFPRMTDYVVPSGVRIADADRVRLGAHLAEGTTVMHEGFVNFNAGTLGHSMVEGRISAGVVVGTGSDIGGGASIMGTLSGGGSETISIGSGCLLGANAGVGISLGDGCTVEAGLYVTAGTQVTLVDGSVVKARELSGRSGLLFRRNSRSGAVEALAVATGFGGLNEDLHSHN